MSVIEPDTGELLDRLTILARKILERPTAEHFIRERVQIIDRLGHLPLNGEPLINILELAAVNAALWQAESTVRGYRQMVADKADTHEDATNLAFLFTRVQRLNDRRAELIQQFNASHGNGAKEEKIR